MILSRASLTTPAALRGSLLLRPISRPMSSPSTSTEMSISESKAADKESMMGKAQDWLASPEGGARFKSCETPALYVSESAAPFPTNPAFIPPHPLSQSTKEAVYALYKAHPETWTPRKLAVHFGMSIARSTAILRLKSLEEQLKASGKAPQTDLSQGMEKMLRPLTLIPGRNVRPYEPERSDYAESMTPYFRFANETETFTPEVGLSYRKSSNVLIFINYKHL